MHSENVWNNILLHISFKKRQCIKALRLHRDEILRFIVKNNRKIHSRGRFSSTKQSLDAFQCNEKKRHLIFTCFIIWCEIQRVRLNARWAKKIKRNKNEIKKFTKQKTNEWRIIEGISVIVFIFIRKICLPQE